MHVSPPECSHGQDLKRIPLDALDGRSSFPVSAANESAYRGEQRVGPPRGNVSAGRALRTDPFAGRCRGICWPSIFDARRRPQLAIARVISAKTPRPTSPAPTASSDHNLSERTPSTGPAVAAVPMSHRCGRSSHSARVCASDLSAPTKTSSSIAGARFRRFRVQ